MSDHLYSYEIMHTICLVTLPIKIETYNQDISQVSFEALPSVLYSIARGNTAVSCLSVIALFTHTRCEIVTKFLQYFCTGHGNG